MNTHGDMEPLIWDYPEPPEETEYEEEELKEFEVSLYVYGQVKLKVEAKDEDEAISLAEWNYFHDDILSLAENMELEDIYDEFAEEI